MQGSIPIQQVAIIILHFRGVCQVYFSHTSCAVYIPQAKAWGFDGRALTRLSGINAKGLFSIYSLDGKRITTGAKRQDFVRRCADTINRNISFNTI